MNERFYELYQGDCLTIMRGLEGRKYCVVTDPPFNIGYHYSMYKDRMPEKEYFKWLREVFDALEAPFVCVHYPETLYRLAVEMGKIPNKVVSWVYNSNTAKQHRDIAFFGVTPDMRKVTQPYKNPNDKRIKALMESGRAGARLYDWWNINQVKNVQKKEIEHPCIMPVEVMENIVKIIPDDYVIIDPFMGSGTTGIACMNAGRRFVGIELDSGYFDIAERRIEESWRKAGAIDG